MDETRRPQPTPPPNQDQAPVGRTDATRKLENVSDRAHGLTEAHYRLFEAFLKRYENQK